MKENIVKEKGYAFAVKTVLLCKQLTENKKEFILSRQLLRSGTAIGALVRESEQAESKADFIHKLSIALKEANETDYWVSLLKDTGYISLIEYKEMTYSIQELLRLLISIIKRTKENLK